MHSYQMIEKGMPIEKAAKAVIMLHGRGGSAQDILSFTEKIVSKSFYIASLQATNHTWYPYSFMSDENLNEPWLTSAIGTVKKCIDETSRYIPKEQIYLLGFSQGACLSLEVASRNAEKYGGIIAFSGGLIGMSLNEKNYHGNFKGTHVFMGVSEQDPFIPLKRVEESKELLLKRGANVILKVYSGKSHSINEDEMLQAKSLLGS